MVTTLNSLNAAEQDNKTIGAGEPEIIIRDPELLRNWSKLGLIDEEQNDFETPILMDEGSWRTDFTEIYEEAGGGLQGCVSILRLLIGRLALGVRSRETRFTDLISLILPSQARVEAFEPAYNDAKAVYLDSNRRCNQVCGRSLLARLSHFRCCSYWCKVSQLTALVRFYNA